jgi:uncharacterized protein involved in outer membrane biogenesis
MRRFLIIVSVLAGLYLIVMLGAGLVIKALLAGDASEAMRDELTQRFPVEVDLGDGDFDLKQWFLLRPAVTLKDLAIGNPEGFSSFKMIEAGEISGQVSLTSLLSRQPRVEHIMIVNPTVRIETNQYGRNNLSSIAPESSPDTGQVEGAGEQESSALAIDALTITGGRLELVDLASNETLTLDNMELRLTDFSTTAEFNLDISANPFGGERSTVSFSGQAGPFLQESFPADGDLSITLAVAEIPEKTRITALGESLRQPGPDSVVRMDTKVSGDLIGTLNGGGTLAFEGFEFGRDAEHRLPLSGKVPLALTVKGALNNPSLNLNATNASLELGDGDFDGNLQLGVGFGGTRGQLDGSITGVDIDQMLSTFTESSGTIYGTAAIPKFELAFAGKDGNELMDSLTGNGTVSLDEGRITFMDTIDSVLTTAGALLKMTGLARSNEPAEEGGASDAPAETAGAEAPDGQTAFTTMSSDVVISNRIVRMSNIKLASPSGDIDGDGQFDFDTVMDFDLTAHISGEVADALGGKPDANGVIRATVPFYVTGTFAAPRVKPDVAHLAVGAGTRILEGLLGGGKEGEDGERTPSILDIFKK